MEKKCSKCKQIKDTSLFSKNKSTNDGLAYYCKECVSEYMKGYSSEYYKKNRKKCDAAHYKYVKNKPEAQKKANRNWTKNNPGAMAKAVRKCEAKRPEYYKIKDAERAMKQYARNKDKDEFKIKSREKSAKYYLNHKKEILKKYKEKRDKAKAEGR